MNNKPIILISLYLFITLFIYVGFNYENEKINVIVTCIYCSINYICIILGYSAYKNKNNINNQYKNKYYSDILFAVVLLSIINSFVNIFIYYTFDNIISYLMSPGKAYEYTKFIRRHHLDTEGIIRINNPIISIILTITSFSKFYVIVFMTLYWKKISTKLKILSILAIIIYIVQCFLFGMMMNIAFIFYTYLPIIISYENKIKKIYKYITYLCVFVMFISISYFLGNRNNDNISFMNTVFYGIKGIAFYVSHGYVGLSYCLQLDFMPTWGFTSLYGFTRSIKNQEIISLWNNSYLMRSERIFRWPALSLWSTIFPWLASDITFYLVPIIMLFIGFYMHKIWNNVIKTKSPFAYLVMTEIFTCCFMIPANNSLFHSFASISTLVIILFCYLIEKKYD